MNFFSSILTACVLFSGIAQASSSQAWNEQRQRAFVSERNPEAK